MCRNVCVTDIISLLLEVMVLILKSCEFDHVYCSLMLLFHGNGMQREVREMTHNAKISVDNYYIECHLIAFSISHIKFVLKIDR